MIHGIIESESLDDMAVLHRVKIVKAYQEQHPEANTKTWTINKIELSGKNIAPFLKKLPESIKPEWYALLWDSKRVYVVFWHKVFQISNVDPWKKEEFQQVIDYGVRQGVQRKYWLKMRETITNW